MKNIINHIMFINFIIINNFLNAQSIVEFTTQGISDGIRNTKQRDRDEAIIDAKLKAIEIAGVNIKSITEVENFVLKKDMIESKSEAYILPGLKTVEMGYGEDGLYHVVLIGKLKIISDNEVPDINNENLFDIAVNIENRLNFNKMGINYINIIIDDKQICELGNWYSVGDILDSPNNTLIIPPGVIPTVWNGTIKAGWHIIKIHYQSININNDNKVIDFIENLPNQKDGRKFLLDNSQNNKLKIILIGSAGGRLKGFSMSKKYSYNLEGVDQSMDYIDNIESNLK
jgi:hypothetical protein